MVDQKTSLIRNMQYKQIVSQNSVDLYTLYDSKVCRVQNEFSRFV